MPLQHLKRHLNFGGRGEIRTHGGLAPTTVFKTVALNRSATLPIKILLLFRLLIKTVFKTVACRYDNFAHCYVSKKSAL